MIKFRDKFIIDADEHNIVIRELGTVQDEKSKNFGEETITVLGYYTTLEGALLGLEKILIRRSIRDKQHTLKSIVEEIRALHRELKSLIGGE